MSDGVVLESWEGVEDRVAFFAKYKAPRRIQSFHSRLGALADLFAEIEARVCHVERVIVSEEARRAFFQSGKETHVWGAEIEVDDALADNQLLLLGRGYDFGPPHCFLCAEIEEEDFKQLQEAP